MSEFKTIQDRIDEYIGGTMAGEERAIFEDELRNDAELRREVMVNSSISEAVQSVHLKQMLKSVERELADSAKVTPQVPHVNNWRWFYQLAAVAAVVAILFFSNILWQSHRVKGFGNEYLSALVAPSVRGDDSVDNMLDLAYSQMIAGEYDLARKTIDTTMILIDEGLVAPVTDEISEYEHSSLMLKRYDAEWYKALVVMMQGNYREAKASLREIAKGTGPYVPEAKNILDNMYHINN